MKIPNAENAILDIGKLRGYCLNSAHGKGKDKARVFISAWGRANGCALAARRDSQKAAFRRRCSAN
jgi:hypothetical protein